MTTTDEVPAVVVCLRVDTVEKKGIKVTEGSEITECGDCGVAIWALPSRAGDMKPMLKHGAANIHDAFSVVPVPEGAINTCAHCALDRAREDEAFPVETLLQLAYMVAIVDGDRG